MVLVNPYNIHITLKNKLKFIQLETVFLYTFLYIFIDINYIFINITNKNNLQKQILAFSEYEIIILLFNLNLQ